MVRREPEKSATGSNSIVTPTPKRRSAGPVAVIWIRKATTPIPRLKVPNKRVRRSGLPAQRSLATRLNWNWVHCVTMATVKTISASAVR